MLGEIVKAHELDVLAVRRRLRELRGARSREEFAQAMGVHPNSVTNYERRRSPPLEFLARVVERTGCDAAWLYFGVPGGRYGTEALSDTTRAADDVVLASVVAELPLILAITRAVLATATDGPAALSAPAASQLVGAVFAQMKRLGIAAQPLPPPETIELSVQATRQLLGFTSGHP